MDVKEFTAAHADPKDPAKFMLEELARRQKSLSDAKIQTVQFLTPIRGKHGWDASLSGNETDIENLASLIEVSEGLVEEVRIDVIEYARLQGEIDDIKKAQSKVDHLKSVRNGTSNYYRNVVLGAIEDNAGTDLSDISRIPKVAKAKAKLQEAEADLEKAELELTPIIANLEARKAQASQILSKYSQQPVI